MLYKIIESCEEAFLKELKNYGHICDNKLRPNGNAIVPGIVTVVKRPFRSSTPAFYVLEIFPNGVRGIEWPVVIENECIDEIRSVMFKSGDLVAFSSDCVNRNNMKIEIKTNNSKLWFVQREIPSLCLIKPPVGYKKISELVSEERDVNIFGVVRTIAKESQFRPNKHFQYHAVVALDDETCESEQFLVHIFHNKKQTTHQQLVLKNDSVVRVRHMKTERYCNLLDGRVFTSNNIVTYIPNGNYFNIFTTCENYYHTAQEEKYVKHLISWNKRRPPLANDSSCATAIHSQQACTTLNQTSPSKSKETVSQIVNAELTVQTLCANASTCQREYTFLALKELNIQNMYKVYVAITNIQPPLSKSKVDFVSGICSECNKTILYSKISSRVEDELVCATCLYAGKIVKLQLMFLLQFELTDKDGKQLQATVAGKNAEILFGCTAANFLRTPILRYAIHTILTELVAQKTYMDMCLSPATSSDTNLFEVSNTTIVAYLNAGLARTGEAQL